MTSSNDREFCIVEKCVGYEMSVLAQLGPGTHDDAGWRSENQAPSMSGACHMWKQQPVGGQNGSEHALHAFIDLHVDPRLRQ